MSKRIQFTTIIQQFQEHGEKTGWTYIIIPSDIAQQLKPGNKKEFRVKGKLDNYAINRMALLPMGRGDFMMPLNATIRKNIGKRKGAMLTIKIEVDDSLMQISKELMECLRDEPTALDFFNKLSKSHQGYFNKWIETARTEPTKAKRITQTITALLKHQHFGQMMQALKG